MAITDIQANEILFRNVELNKVNPLRLQWCDYHNTKSYRSPCEGWASDSTGSILNRRRLWALQRHNGDGLVALNESHPFNLQPNGQLFN